MDLNNPFDGDINAQVQSAIDTPSAPEPSLDDVEAPSTPPAPEATAEQPEQIKDSNYRNIPINNFDDVFKVRARISEFGDQKGAGSDKGDNGRFAFGGGSVDNQEMYAAIDPAWYKRGIKPGSTVNVINPKTGQSVSVVLRDKGPARWTGRGIDVAPNALKALGMDTDEDAVIDFKPAIAGAGQEVAQGDQQTGQEDLTTSEGAKSYVDRATSPGGSPMMAETGQQSGAQTDVTATSDKLGVTKLADGGYDLGGGVVGYKNGIFQMRTGNSVTEYIPDPSQASGYKTHTFTTKPPTVKSGKELMVQEAAKKGVIREDYPEGPEGDKAYNDEAKLTLGAGVADDIAESIMSGKQPPDTKGLYRTGPMVRAKLAQKGYDLKDANLDWQAAQRFVLSQNSPPLVRLRQSATTADHSLDVIDELAAKWKGGHYPPLNKAKLVLAQQGAFGPDAASIARQLDGQITDLTFELGNVYMGGGTPTDQALGLAKKNLSSDWDEKVLHDMTDLARRNIHIRLNSFKQVEPAGMSEEAGKEARWNQNPNTSPTPSATPSPSGAPAQHYVGEPVTLRNGQSVIIKTIRPDGTFTY